MARGWLSSWLVAWLAFSFVQPGNAQATPTAEASGASDAAHVESDELGTRPGVGQTLLAIGPGLFVHGLGAWSAGDPRTGKRLMLSEAVGLGTLLAAGGVLAGMGASRRLVGPLSPLIVAGGASFMLGWLADIYAASTGGRNRYVTSWVSPLEAELGYRYVYDPQFAYRNFSFVRGDFRAGRFRASPSGWFALDDDNQRLTLDLAFRMHGRTPHRGGNDGSYLDASSAFTVHRYAQEGFRVYTPEWRLDGRWDLSHVGSSLRGSFVEGHLGAGLELYHFDAQGSRLRDNATGLLLARFGFGVYFGDGHARTGEALLYYDHRHDDFAAGLGVQGIAGGVLGHFGLSSHYFVSAHWGVSLLCEVGSAFVGGLGLRYRAVPRGAASKEAG